MSQDFASVDTSAYNRVPGSTPEFWLIKLMAVTMGETAADYLSVQMGLGLTATSILMSLVLIARWSGSSGKNATSPRRIGWRWC